MNNIHRIIKSLVFVILLMVLPSLIYAQNARISTKIGNVRARLPQGDIVDVYVGMQIEQGTTIRTDSVGLCEVTFANGSKVRIMQSTTVSFATLSPNNISVDMRGGDLFSKMGALTQGQSYEVNTPTLVAGVRGTFFRTTITENQTTQLGVIEGAVRVNNPNIPNQNLIINERQSIELGSNTAPTSDLIVPLNQDIINDMIIAQEPFGETLSGYTPVQPEPEDTTQPELVEESPAPTPSPEPIVEPTPEPTPLPPTPTQPLTDTPPPTEEIIEESTPDPAEELEVPAEIPEEPTDTGVGEISDTTPTVPQEEVAESEEVEEAVEGEEEEGPKLPGGTFGGLPSEDDIFGLTGSVGPISFGENVYAGITLNPRFNFGFIFFGLYLPIYFRDVFNNDLPIEEKIGNYSDWDFKNVGDGFYDVFNKIEFLGVNLEFDSWRLYLMFGNISNFEFGHGFVVDGFTNALAFPLYRRFGMNMQLDFGYAGLEALIGDLKYDDMMLTGVRVFVRPIWGLVPIFGDLHIGFSVISDVNPMGNNSPLDATDTPYIDDTTNNPSIFTTGFDVGLPILDYSWLSLMFYTDVATHGYDFDDWEETVWGEADVTLNPQYAPGYLDNKNHYFDFSNVGLGTGIKGMIISMIEYRIEYRRIFNGFVPGFYDRFYDAQRSSKGKLDDIIFSEGNYNGLVGVLGFVWEGVGHIQARYEHIFGKEFAEDPSMPSDVNYLHMELAIYKGLIPYFYFTFAYDRKDIRSADDFSDNFLSEHSMLSLLLGIEVAEGVDIIATWRRTFVRDYNTGELKSDDSIAVGTEMTFF